MDKIGLSADSTCDLDKNYLDKYDIHTLPLYIHLDNKEYLDMIDIDPEFIYKNYDEKKVLPKTAAPSVGDCIKHFEKLKEDYDKIIHITIGSGFSSSFQNALIASENFEDIYVIDSKCLSSGSGLLLLEARDLIDKDKDVEEVVDILNSKLDKLSVSFVINSLTYLREGGRLSALQAFGANVLNIKPQIIVTPEDNGKMIVGKKYRGNIDSVTKKYMKELLASDNIDMSRMIFTHSGATQEQIDKCLETVREYSNPDKIYINQASCTIASHCGYNTFGLIFFEK